MKIRSELFKEVQARLNTGMRKAQIYTELKEKYPAAAVERSLAQWPYPEAKIKNRSLNVPLLIVVIVFALVKILYIVAFFQTLEPGAVAAAIPLAALTVIIYLYIIYGVKNYNLIGYLLVLLMTATTLLSTRSIGTGNLLPLALSAAALALAWMQKTRLFPNTSWFLRHKKDGNGNIIF
ncbi:MAG: hypothetical protein PHP93_05170 [Kiritimatiellales bacterium]|nr:hypothetical protein [Kiritimatiellales bacterium]